MTHINTTKLDLT